jgi:hypothetical protein
VLALELYVAHELTFLASKRRVKHSRPILRGPPPDSPVRRLGCFVLLQRPALCPAEKVEQAGEGHSVGWDQCM